MNGARLLVHFVSSSGRPSDECTKCPTSHLSGLAVQPGQGFGHCPDSLAGWHLGPVNQDNGQPKLSRRDQFGFRPGAARVLGDDHVDAVVLQKGEVALSVKRPTGDDHLCFRQGQSFDGWVDKAQKVVMLRGPGEKGKVLASDGEEDPTRCMPKGSGGTFKVGDMGPAIGFSGLPGFAFNGQQGDKGRRASFDRVPAYSRRERVGGVDDMGDAFVAQECRQSFDTPEAANADGKGLGDGGFGPAGVRVNGVHARGSQGLRHLGGLGRSAQKKDARHG